MAAQGVKEREYGEMTEHRRTFTPGVAFTWTVTAIACSFLILFAVAAGGSIFQWTIFQLSASPGVKTCQIPQDVLDRTTIKGHEK